jgi:hypothetical protein
MYQLGNDVLIGSEIGFLEIFMSEDEKNKRKAAVKFLEDHIGLPYLWGGKNPNVGLDCCGAVTAAWEAAGIIPRGTGAAYTAQALYRATEPVSSLFVQPGDLAFYGNWHYIHHVMLVAENGRVIGAIGKGIPLKYEDKVKYGTSDFYGFGRAPIDKKLPPPDDSKRWWPLAIPVIAGYAAYRELSARKLFPMSI